MSFGNFTFPGPLDAHIAIEGAIPEHLLSDPSFLAELKEIARRQEVQRLVDAMFSHVPGGLQAEKNVILFPGTEKRLRSMKGICPLCARTTRT